MAANFHLNERSGIYINGALVTADRRVRLSVTGAQRILLESQLIPESANDDPLSGLATLLQQRLLASEAFAPAEIADDLVYRDLIRQARAEAPDRDADGLLADVHMHLTCGRIHQALRLLRKTVRQGGPPSARTWLGRA